MTDDETSRDAPSRVPVVGIGASAGGLEALQAFVRDLPAEPSFAAVVVQHLDPKVESALHELLGRETSAPVEAARDGAALERGRLYVAPAGQSLEVVDGRIRLSEPAAHGAAHGVDAMLRSVATDADGHGIAVILSGTGHDGVAGLREVKAAGGLVIAQDPETAEHSGMPKAAIATHLVDLVLAPSAMAAELERLAHDPLGASASGASRRSAPATSSGARPRRGRRPWTGFWPSSATSSGRRSPPSPSPSTSSVATQRSPGRSWAGSTASPATSASKRGSSTTCWT